MLLHTYRFIIFFFYFGFFILNTKEVLFRIKTVSCIMSFCCIGNNNRISTTSHNKHWFLTLVCGLDGPLIQAVGPVWVCCTCPTPGSTLERQRLPGGILSSWQCEQHPAAQAEVQDVLVSDVKPIQCHVHFDFTGKTTFAWLIPTLVGWTSMLLPEREWFAEE